MIDPYIRRSMTSTANGHTVRFKMPDQYGVFTLKVDYKRQGLSFISASERVQVRQVRHDQYPRFLVVARPYYTGFFSVFIGFVVFGAVFVYHRERVDASKKDD